ncbi:Beta-amylase [Rhynchospora pubera]|uniref:Beta-amylase n=1 Tax=Rhynchospora pubera TaxID=906938 RepID=A0AAV8E4J3_9POAL|nr:Beta-amylase [Rhynchospora pubera]
MALSASSPLLIPHTSRPPKPLTFGLPKPHLVVPPHREVMIKGSLQGSFLPGANPATAFSRFTASATSGEEETVTKKDYVPIYVMLPLGVVNSNCEVADPDTLIKDLKLLKSIGIDGVMVDIWWGIVEPKPLDYNWTGYKNLFEIIKRLNLKLQVVMSFHKCGGNVGDDVTIPLPSWIREVGANNPDIFFTDKHGNRNTECLSWGIDLERVLRGRTALQVYYDFMASFRAEMDSFFEDDLISEIEIGMGPCGELRFPSYPMEFGWTFPGIGEFECYDRYLMDKLRIAARETGQPSWGNAPNDEWSYNSVPQDTDFFCDGGEYDGFYGRFFLGWYSGVLVEHANHVLHVAKLAFHGSSLAVKVSGVHWLYKTRSHAAELTTGFYNPSNRDGYSVITKMLKMNDVALNFTCVELVTANQPPEALSDPEALVWQVLNTAWDAGIEISSENALPCYSRDGFEKILKIAKPLDDPRGRHLRSFTYLRLSSDLFEKNNWSEFKRFVKKMHNDRFVREGVYKKEEENEDDLVG